MKVGLGAAGWRSADAAGEELGWEGPAWETGALQEVYALLCVCVVTSPVLFVLVA